MSEYSRDRCKRPLRFIIIAFIAAIALSVFSCVHSVYSIRATEALYRSGGFYQPWLEAHEQHYSEVLACVGLPSRLPRPALWIVSNTLIDHRGDSIVAYYERMANVIVFSPYAIESRERYWLIFRHEVIHSAEPPVQQSAKSPDYIHSRWFALAESCLFWPSMDISSPMKEGAH